MYYIAIREISLQVLDNYNVWPERRTALHNYKRQGRLVSEKPVVEQPITQRIMSEKTMATLTESVSSRERY